MKEFRYINNTAGILCFRAHNAKVKEAVYALKPGTEMESDRKVSVGGLELVSKQKSNKTEDKGE